MAYSDELLKDTVLTEEFILEELQNLKEYYDAMEVASQVFPAVKDAPMPSMAAILEEDEKGRNRVVTHSFLPLDEDDASYTKFLQFYCELQIDVGGVDRLRLMEALMTLNGMLPLGTAVAVAARDELPAMVGLRYVQGYPLEEVIDQGAFCETLFLFDLSCDLVSTVVDALVEGASVENALSRLHS